jgi:hypothetical protein
LPQAIAPFQLQPFINHLTSMQLIPDATKTTILQPYIGVGKGLISYSVSKKKKDLIKDFSLF